MAIDFSKVQLITIPEGDVKSISSGGTTLWDSNGKSWHTRWSGSETIHVTANSSQGSAYHFATTYAGTGTNPILRITFEFLNPRLWPNVTPQFYLNSLDSIGDTMPTSPAVFKRTSPYLVGVKFGSGNYTGAMISTDNDTANNRLYITLNYFAGGNMDLRPNGTVQLRVTKIEQYY